MYRIIVNDVDGNPIDHLVQWDRNIAITIEQDEITEAYPLHFFNSRSEEALVVQTTYDGGKLKGEVPNILLESPYPITGYVAVSDGDSQRNMFGFKIEVINKPKPSNLIYEDDRNYLLLEDVLEDCKEYAGNASDSATQADEAKQAAQLSQQEAAKSEASAKESAAAALKSEQAAKDSENAAKESQTAAQQSMEQAQQSQTEAANSAAAALKSQQAAEQARTEAADSAANALQSANDASDSKDAAAASQAAALESEKRAKESQDAAALSQQAAADSEANAETYKNDAAGSAQTASEAAQTATEAKDAALASQTAAQASEKNAEDYAKKAQSYAEGGTGLRPEEDTDNAQYYYEQITEMNTNVTQLAEQVHTDAEAAAGSAAAADTSATGAEASNQSALEAAERAETALQNIGESESNAQDAAQRAETAADNLEALLQDVMSDRLLSTNLSATIPASGWAASDNNLQSVTVQCAGLLETDNPFIDVVLTKVKETDTALRKAWRQIQYIDTAAGSLVVYAYTPPATDVPVTVKVVR